MTLLVARGGRWCLWTSVWFGNPKRGYSGKKGCFSWVILSFLCPM